MTEGRTPAFSKADVHGPFLTVRFRPQAADQLERRAIINLLTVLTGSYLTPDLERKEQPMQIQHELAPLASKLWFGFDFSSIHCTVPGSGEPGGRFHP